MQNLPHSALNPVGPQAAAIATLWHQLETGAIVVVVLVFLALAVALRRGRGEGTPTSDRSAGTVIGWAVAASTVILLLVVVASIHADRRADSRSGVTPLQVQVIGHDWWWEITYPDSNPSEQITTANELHVPTGRPVELRLTSDDVIHSFWVPNVAGKTDLVPGRFNRLTFVVDTAGAFIGNCAEFCGLNHARMRMTLIAQSPADFAAWEAGQRLARLPPNDSTLEYGEQIFVSSQCAFCHTVRGTIAHGILGPDLTHFGSRRSLAAGIAPNNPGTTATWIVMPSNLKPGTLMPPTRLASTELTPLVAWLESLK